MIEFVVLGRPQPAGSKRAFKHPHTGRIVVTDAARNSQAWKQQVAHAAFQACITPLEGPLEVRCVFYCARPKSHYGSGRNAARLKRSAPEFPTTRPDVDKLSRAVLDGMTGVVYRDDAQVVRKWVEKRYGVPERVEVVVAEARSAGGTLEVAA